MDKSNLELFKQAISEAVSNKFDNIAANRSEEIVCSERHDLAIRAIMYGKSDVRRSLSPKAKRIIAILIAAALLLTSCGIIFHNEIREVIEELYVSVTFGTNDSTPNTIEDIYELTYLPDGYYLEKENISHTVAVYNYTNSEGDTIYFEQGILDGSGFVINSEKGYSKIVEIKEHNVYYRYTEESHSYIWNDGTYVLTLSSNQRLSNEDIEKIIKGIK